MSQKRTKKRKPQGPKTTKNPGELQQTEKYKRFNPLARNLLWADLIFLAVVQLLYSKEIITTAIADGASILGLILLLTALYLNFMPKKEGPKPPRR